MINNVIFDEFLRKQFSEGKKYAESTIRQYLRAIGYCKTKCGIDLYNSTYDECVEFQKRELSADSGLFGPYFANTCAVVKLFIECLQSYMNNIPPQKTTVTYNKITTLAPCRDQNVRNQVIDNALGVCKLCGRKTFDVNSNDFDVKLHIPELQSHHIIPL
jgi:hypothetical protein